MLFFANIRYITPIESNYISYMGPAFTWSQSARAWPHWVTSHPIRLVWLVLDPYSCVRLIRAMHEQGIGHIGLNVSASNAAAIKLYQNLGFTKVAEYVICQLIQSRDRHMTRLVEMIQHTSHN